MLHLKYVSNISHIKWLSSFLKFNNVNYKRFFCFYFFKKEDFLKINDYYNDNLTRSKTINEFSGFDKSIIEYSDENKIYHYDLSKILKKMSEDFFISFEQEYDIDEYSLRIKINDGRDTIESILYCYNGDYDKNNLIKIINGEKIMSKNKEDKIIDAVVHKLSDYDINIGNYNYFIKKEFSNSYEIELEHKTTGALILIRSIKTDDENTVKSIGENRGLVL